MHNRQITRVLMLGTFAIIGIIAVQTYWVTSTWNINEQEFEEKINYILYTAACSIAEANSADLPKKDIIKRRNSNYYIVNIDSEINPGRLEFSLKEAMEAWALNIDFEYAIYDCSSDEMVYGNYCNYELNAEPKVIVDLPASENNISNYYFGIRFPTRSNYLLSKVQLSIFFSLILLLTILFFAYSMYVMLRQNRLSKMQKEFINNMTHEFKTPLSTIKIAADVFAKSPLIQSDKRLHTYANIIKEQNQRLNNQVERVLNIAKFEQNDFNLKKEQLPLLLTLQGFIANESLRFEELGGKIELDLPAEEIYIEADRFHFLNVLSNLLDNALKYCKKVPNVNLRIQPLGKKIELRIRDHGIGIAKEHQQTVFEKFYRIPTGNIHNVKGFGIGLFYVKKICETHGWNLELQSELDQFTEFIITMPTIKTT